MEYIVTLP